MSFKQASELRKSGKLAEALEMALQDLQREPDNVLFKRSMAWVYYDYLKTNKGAVNFDSFYSYLIKIKELELPEAENMFFDQCAWQVGVTIFNLLKNDKNNSSSKNIKAEGYSKEIVKSVYALFILIKDFNFTKPNESYTFLFKAFHRAFKDSEYYKEFADWWNFENFRNEDFLNETLPNGKPLMSIAEQAYIAYSKILLSGNYSIMGWFVSKPVPEDIKVFLPKLDIIIEKHPKLQYPTYYKAKLLVALGDIDNVLSEFIPFAIRKKSIFWVWDVLSDVFPANDIRKKACLCKALSCGASDDFLVKIREKLVGVLVNENQYVEAKTEIENIVATRNNNNWNITDNIKIWLNQSWYKNAQSKKDNSDLYASLLPFAEEILLEDIPERTVVVEFVNSDKKILNFVESKTTKGFFYYGNHLEKVSIGDVLKARFKGNSQEEHYRLLSAKITDEVPATDVIKEFSDNLKIMPNINIGFAGDVFIDSRTITKNNLQQGQLVKGKAIISYNNKKQEWGWKAIQVNINC